MADAIIIHDDNGSHIIDVNYWDNSFHLFNNTMPQRLVDAYFSCAGW